MGLHRDFMMRMIESMAAAFFRILAGKKTEDPNQAQLEIESLVGEALGTDADYAMGLGPAAIDTVDPPLAAQLGRLLCLHATLSDKIGAPDRASRARRMGFRAIQRSLTRPGTDFADIATTTLRDNLALLESVIPASELAEACIAAHLHTVEREEWAETEDWLYFAIELAPEAEHEATASAFFRELLEREDSVIESGGLSREEVLTSLDGLGT